MYEFVPKKQAKATFPLAGTNNTVSLSFVSPTKSNNADDLVTTANKLFAIGGKSVAVDGSERVITEEAQDNG